MHSSTIALAVLAVLVACTHAQHCTDPKSACAAAGAAENNTATSGDTCALKGPIKHRIWVPEEPSGPSGPSSKYRKVPLNNKLRLEVLVRSSAEGSDGLKRATASWQVQNLNVTVLPKEADFGSDALHKVLLARKSDPSLVLMVIDEADEVIFAGEATEILRKFQESKAKVLFGAIRRCRTHCALDWPEAPSPYCPRYMDPYSFIGYAADMYTMIDKIPPPSTKIASLKDEDYLLTLFLNPEDRTSLGMQIDYDTEIFQAVNGWKDDLIDEDFSLTFTFHGEPDTRIYNNVLGTSPCVFRNDGNNRLFNQIGNYVPLRWTPEDGCLHCKENLACLPEDSNLLPPINVIFYVDRDAGFLSLVLDSLGAQTYPKKHIHLHIGVATGPSVSRYIAVVNEWLAVNRGSYASVSLATNGTEFAIRKTLFLAANATNSPFTFFMDSTVYLTNNDTIRSLMKQDRTFVAPLVSRIGKYWSNFWGSTEGDYDAQCFDDHPKCPVWAIEGECETNPEFMEKYCAKSCSACKSFESVDKLDYKRSFDFLEIVERQRKGVWNMPYVFAVYLAKNNAINILAKELETAATQNKTEITSGDDWLLGVYTAQWLRKAKIHLMVSNFESYGDLVNNNLYDHKKTYPELFMLIDNNVMWEKFYLNSKYNASGVYEWIEPHCWDIYNFPLFSERFCIELVNETENFGQWSGGTTYDKRLKGGYEPVPTRDIHFYQMGFQEQWHYILKKYVAPIVERFWPGYHLEGTQTLDFVVKYQPEGQPFLRPHHDASTFSMNVALNRIGIDFEGGGTKFHRQNCTFLKNEMGHVVVHPGRLTHQHEGLYVTKGTRYIIVSFVDQV